MAQIVQLAAEPRTVHGTGEMRRMRKAGRTPAVIYGHGRAPAALSVSSFDLGRLLESIAPASTIVDLTVGDATYKTLIREVQRHPLRPGVTHVDFYEVKAGEKITLEVPVHLVGIPDGVRNQGGTLVSALAIPNAKILTDAGLTICTVVAPRVEEVVAPVAAAVVEGAVVEGAEGAAPAAPVGTAPAEPELIRKRKAAEDEEEK
jgi:large subunit ribosomal protein L25